MQTSVSSNQYFNSEPMFVYQLLTPLLCYHMRTGVVRSLSQVCVSPAQDVDASVATRHRDAKLNVELTRNIHHGGGSRQRHLQQSK